MSMTCERCRPSSRIFAAMSQSTVGVWPDANAPMATRSTPVAIKRVVGFMEDLLSRDSSSSLFSTFVVRAATNIAVPGIPQNGPVVCRPRPMLIFGPSQGYPQKTREGPYGQLETFHLHRHGRFALEPDGGLRPDGRALRRAGQGPACLHHQR